MEKTSQQSDLKHGCETSLSIVMFDRDKHDLSLCLTLANRRGLFSVACFRFVVSRGAGCCGAVPTMLLRQGVKLGTVLIDCSPRVRRHLRPQPPIGRAETSS